MKPNKTAADVGRLLEVMGVDRVIAVDLERPGTGSGGAFLGPGIPVETLLTTNIFAEHIAEKILGKDKSHQRGVTVISVRERGREAARDEGREGKGIPNNKPMASRISRRERRDCQVALCYSTEGEGRISRDASILV